jgi:gliding motility-associated-like protein
MDFMRLVIWFGMLLGTNAMLHQCQAQPNLVPNPGFEEYVNCPYVEPPTTPRIDPNSNLNVKHWFRTGGIGYFNKCANLSFGGIRIGIPQNLMGNQEGHVDTAGKISNGYLASGVTELNYSFPTFGNTLWSSYIQCKLNSTLIARLKYWGSFFVSPCGLASEGYASWHASNDSSRFYTISSIGAYFGNAPIVEEEWMTHVVKSAQIQNDSLRNLNDTINWMQISGIFEAKGTEAYLALGNFNEYKKTKFFNSYGYPEPWIGQQFVYATYFFDNVSLIPQNTTHTYDTLMCFNAPVLLGAVEQADSFEWSDGNKQDKVRQFTQTGWVWVKSWLYGGTVFMLDSFNIKRTEDLSSGLPQDTFLCYGINEIELATTIQPAHTSLLWSNGSTNPAQVFTRAALAANSKVWVQITKEHCSQIDSIHIGFNKPVFIPMPADTQLCFTDVPRIILDAGKDFKTYLWLPSGETSRQIISTQAEKYLLSITDSLNCEASKTVEVKDVCGNNIYFPNAFTPNGDGLNDIYLPVLKAKNIEVWEMRIYNRWGVEVFFTQSINQGWDGSNAASENYIILFTYKLKDQSQTNTLSQSFTLIR